MKLISERRLTNRGFFGLFALIILLLPLFITDRYYHHILITGFYMSICALGWRLILLGGQFSVAHMAFVGIGAYASSLAVMRFGLCYWAALPLSGLVSAILGVIICFPALRLRGAYFAIMSVVLAMAFNLLFMNWTTVTGGATGLTNIPPPTSISIPGLVNIQFKNTVSYYYLIVFLLLITIMVMRRIDTSRLGNIIRAVAQNEALAESIGINRTQINLITFAIGCFWAGIAGSFYAHYASFISPASFTVWNSAFISVYAIVGGIGSVIGPIVGSFALNALWEALRELAEYQALANALLLVAILIFLPGGLISLPHIFENTGICASTISALNRWLCGRLWSR